MSLAPVAVRRIAGRIKLEPVRIASYSIIEAPSGDGKETVALHVIQPDGPVHSD